MTTVPRLPTALPGLLRVASRGVLAGLTGTVAMTATMSLERRLRPHASLPVDYDATEHVVTAASAVLRHTPGTPQGRHALFLLVHWGYGSAVGVGYPALRRAGLSRGRASFAFYVACQGMAFTLFPALGQTPPPWRWQRDVLVSSLTQHLVYAAAVSTVSEPGSWRA